MASIDIFQSLSDWALPALGLTESAETLKQSSGDESQARLQPVRVSVVVGEQRLGDVELPVSDRQVVRKADLRDAIATQLGPEITALWFGDSQPVTLLRQIWNRPSWPLERFYDAEFGTKGLAAAVKGAAAKLTPRPAQTLNVAAGWLSLDLLSELPEQLTVWGDHLRIGLCWGLEPIGAISFGAPGEATFCITAQQIRAAFSQSYSAAMERGLVRSLLGKRPSQEHPWRSQLQQSGLFATAERGVSIIVPAFNAEEYLSQCLESVLTQTYPHWELILVDDGSSDATGAIAQEIAQRDRRVRIIQQPNQGSCAARNNGARLANYDWLAFLDADDWWEPSYLSALMAVADADPTLDAVRCSWNRVTADGTVIETFLAHHRQSAFRTCVLEHGLQVDSCMMRRGLFEAAGSFDPEMVVSQDWDFWPRIARTGARFGIVETVQSNYRTVPSSVSAKAMRLLDYSLIAIDRCYGPDSRLLNPDPRYAQGLEPETRQSIQFHFVLWCAGLAIFQGEDPLPLLAKAPREVTPAPTANSVSDYLKVVVYRSGLPPADWPRLWQQYLSSTAAFIEAIGEHLGLQNDTWTSEVLRQLEYKLLVNGTMQLRPDQAPFSIGHSQARAVEITQPLPKIVADPSKAHEQLVGVVFCEGDRLGHLLLPLHEGQLSDDALADAIAQAYFWPILRQYLTHNVYLSTEVAAHDSLGWEKFLQSLFDQPDWSSAQFYEPDRNSLPQKHLAARNHLTESYQLQRYVPHTLPAGHLTVEISQDLPTLVIDPAVESEELSIVVTVAGCPLGRVSVNHGQGQIFSGKLRTVILETAQLDLCRMVVRQALLGESLLGRSLRQRLRARTTTQTPVPPSSLTNAAIPSLSERSRPQAQPTVAAQTQTE